MKKMLSLPRNSFSATREITSCMRKAKKKNIATESKAFLLEEKKLPFVHGLVGYFFFIYEIRD